MRDLGDHLLVTARGEGAQGDGGGRADPGLGRKGQRAPTRFDSLTSNRESGSGAVRDLGTALRQSETIVGNRDRAQRWVEPRTHVDVGPDRRAPVSDRVLQQVAQRDPQVVGIPQNAWQRFHHPDRPATQSQFEIDVGANDSEQVAQVERVLAGFAAGEESRQGHQQFVGLAEAAVRHGEVGRGWPGRAPQERLDGGAGGGQWAL